MNVAQVVLRAVLLGQQMSPARAAAGGAQSATTVGGAAAWPALGALVLGVVALCLLLPATTGRRRLAGTALGLLSILLILSGMMLPLAPLSAQWVFWALATVTIVAAVAAIATTKPVYTALWFALSLLGTAGLLLFDGAQFLSVSTMAVYAGAILVTFLFVIMLAQPEGHASYDRITWGWYTKSVAALMAALLVGVLTIAMSGAVASPATRAQPDVLQPAHMARFGSELFTKHLLSIEVVGALLLVALVGAISIMIQTGQSAGAPPEGVKR
jgi:NADH-quinone oxidoreductase subunit J